jgi:hypothetical protein
VLLSWPARSKNRVRMCGARDRKPLNVSPGDEQDVSRKLEHAIFIR